MLRSGWQANSLASGLGVAAKRAEKTKRSRTKPHTIMQRRCSADYVEPSDWSKAPGNAGVAMETEDAEYDGSADWSKVSSDADATMETEELRKRNMGQMFVSSFKLSSCLEEDSPSTGG